MPSCYLYKMRMNIQSRTTEEGFCLRKGRKRTHSLKDAVTVTLTRWTLPFSSKIFQSNPHSLTASSCLPHSRTIPGLSPMTLRHDANLYFLSLLPAYQPFSCFCLFCPTPSLSADITAAILSLLPPSQSSLLSSHAPMT